MTRRVKKFPILCPGLNDGSRLCSDGNQNITRIRSSSRKYVSARWESKTRDVVDVNYQKSLELFSNNTFDYLFLGEYIRAPLRAELRQEAVARGFINGGSADYQVTTTQSKAGKTTYQ